MKNVQKISNFEAISFDKREWLITNGIGGYASSTVPCINTRRYHGLLIAARRPPVDRVVLVSRLDEFLCFDNEEFIISSFLQKPEQKNSNGFLHLERFENYPIPTWYYRIKDVMLIKTINMVYGQNTTLVTYKLLTNGKSVSLKIRPHFLFRDFHGNMLENEGIEKNYSLVNNTLLIQPFANAPKLHIRWNTGIFKPSEYWDKNIYLPEENERGLPDTEDDFTCGYIEMKDFTGIASLTFSDIPIEAFNPLDIRKREEQRLETIENSMQSDDLLLKKLLLAADQFIVSRESTENKTILAGYPWFSDWGRDTLISLPGLTLVTGRFDDAKSILKTFAASIRHGLIPNCFADKGCEAMYNSVDASLWFFDAAYRFVTYTDDYDFVREYLYDGMFEIIEAFIHGTINNIKMDKKDGLISSGTNDTQLTWMDVKVNGKAVTPRSGKAVEINALWYNALKIYAMFQEKFEGNSRKTTALAQKVKRNFINIFWNEKEKCLYDYIDLDGVPNDDIRPNQIYAVYLPFGMLEANEEKAIVNKVFEELYTSYGLRSLSPKNKDYHGKYEGDRIERDCRYHQGTVWGFLIGPFITSYLKVHNSSMEALLRASIMIEPFAKHLENSGCIGSVSEIFDGDAPYTPKGCFAQAWSVAEILRCYVEDIKGQKPSLVF